MRMRVRKVEFACNESLFKSCGQENDCMKVDESARELMTRA